MVDAPTGIRILDARVQSLAQINGLIARSKAHWSWPEGYLEKALPLLTVSTEYLRTSLPARDAGLPSATAGPIADTTSEPAVAPVITSPAEGAVAPAGQSLAVTVRADPRAYPTDIAVMGQVPLGSADIQPMTGSIATFNVPIPPNTPPGPYQVTAIGLNADRVLTFSKRLTIDVERMDPVRSFSVPSGFPAGTDRTARRRSDRQSSAR